MTYDCQPGRRQGRRLGVGWTTALVEVLYSISVVAVVRQKEVEDRRAVGQKKREE